MANWQQQQGPPDEKSRLTTGSGDLYDPEAIKPVSEMTPQELEVRRGFVFKVYAILFTQVLFTAAGCAAAALVPAIQDFCIANNKALMYGGLAGSIVCLILLYGCCFEGYSNKYPHNFVLLGFFTLFETIGLACVSAVFCDQGKETLLAAAAGCTMFIFGSLTMYVKFSSRDFSFLGPFLFIGLITCILFGLLAALLQLSTMMVAINIVTILIFIGFILYDTDQILKRTSLEDMAEAGAAIEGAIDLYLDIIQLFLSILSVMDHFANTATPSDLL